VDGKIDAAGAVPDQREHFVEDVLLIGIVAADAVCRVDRFVVPGFGIDAIDTKEHELAGVEAVIQSFNHALVFVLVETTHRGREDEDRMPGMAKL
jgi:hypothetical protein